MNFNQVNLRLIRWALIPTLMLSWSALAINAPRAEVSGTTVSLYWSPPATWTPYYYQLQYRNGNDAWSTSSAKYWGTSMNWYNVTTLNQRSYRMKACSATSCELNWSPSSNVITIEPIPSAPASASVNVIGNDVTLTWGVANYAAYYKLQYKDGSGAWNSSQGTYYGTSNSWYDVPPLQQRSYRMSGCNNSGCSGWSPSSNAITIEPIPSAPASASVNITGNDVTLTWGVANYAAYYKLQYRDGSGAWNSSQGTYYGTSKNWYNVSPLKQRSYRMSGCNNSGCSGWSPSSNAITTNSLPTGTISITGTTTVGQTLTAVANSLADIDGLGAFTYQWLSNGVNLAGAISNNYILSTNEQGKTIKVIISYTDGGGTSESVTSAETAPVTAPQPVPFAPRITLASENYDGNYSVEWSAVSEATSYKLFIVGSASPIYEGSGTSFPQNAMVNGQYSYQVSACNAAGCSENSPTKTIFVYLDDNSIGSIDSDGNGIRDDIELKIAQISPINSLKNGYLQHTAFYTRAFLLATSDVNKKRFRTEMLKGYACLLTSSDDEEAYAQIVAGHLDSKERFERYNHNNSFMNQESITVNNMDCVLKGTGVEPVSGCFKQYSWNSMVSYMSYIPELLMGENVKLTIKVKNLPQWGGTFDFSYFLNGVLQDKKEMANESEAVWVIDNYNFDNDGYLKLQADNPSTATMFEWSVTCESNQ